MNTIEKAVNCRGSWVLGNNCGICPRCLQTKPLGAKHEEEFEHYIKENSPTIEVEEQWYIKHKNATTLVKVLVIDKTEKTVKIKEVDSFSRPGRYEWDDIKFVEKVNETDV